MADVAVTIGVDNKQAISGLKAVGDTAENQSGPLKKFGGALGDVAKIASGFVLAQGLLKLPGLLSGMVAGASDLNESLSKVRTVFGSSSGEIEAFASTAAKNLGMTKGAALEATGTFGNFLIAMGASTPEATKLSKSMVQLATDMGSFNNASPEEVLLALRSGLSGEAEPLKRFGVALSEAAVQAKGAQLGLGKLGKEMSEQEKIQARYALIMEQTTMAQGDFARTSDGLANQTKILKSMFGDLRDELGSALLPKITELAGLFIQLVPYLESAGKAAFEFVAGLAEAAWDKIVGPLTNLKDAALELAAIAWDKLKDAGVFLADLATAGADLAAVAWDKIAGPLAAMAALTWQGIHDAAVAYGQLEKALGTNLISAVQTLWRESEVLRSKTDELKDAGMRLVAVLKPFAEKDLQSLKNAFADVKEAAGPLLEELKKWEPVLKPLLIAVGALTLLGLAPLALAIAGITIVAGTLIDFLAAGFKMQIEATTTVLTGIRTAAEKVQEWFDQWAPKIGAAMTSVYTTILPYINMIKGLFDFAKDLWAAGEAAVKGFLGGFEAAWNAGVGKIKSLINPLNWDIPGGSPLLHAMDEFGNEAGTTFVEAYWDAFTETWVAKAAPAMAMVAASATAAEAMAASIWKAGGAASQQLEDYLGGNTDPEVLAAYHKWLKGEGPMPYHPGATPDWVGGTSIPSNPNGTIPIGFKSGNGTAQVTWDGTKWVQNSGLPSDGSYPSPGNYYGFGYSAANPAPTTINLVVDGAVLAQVVTNELARAM